MTDTDLVLQTFEIAAETGEDITQAVNEAFIAASPTSGELMDHMDEYMLGRMTDEVLTVLMADDVSTQRDYLNFEVDSHRAYGVLPDMYRQLLVAVRDTVRSMLGSAWSADYDAAWDARIQALLKEIDQAALAAGEEV
ncbi:MAG: globin [Gammaproteobacteria bacterium]|nr:globin [Gammaproteobacteria bacterium]